MNTVKLTRSLGLGVTAALLTSAFAHAPASAAPTVPEGSTAVITGLGGGTPGVADGATLTVTAPDGPDSGSDRDPVAGQVFTLTVDHGFFTTGSATPTVVGTRAGDLVQLGTTKTYTTDAAGQIDFAIGIARDGGFDDDGMVTATVSVAELAGSASAVWSTASPLNGQVALVRSPGSEQENPVNPALAGNRTFYDVLALDQFGNRVGGESIFVKFTEAGGPCDDCDNSGDDDVVSDFNLFGDIWTIGFEAGAIDITATWDEAPTYLYTDVAGAAAPVVPSTRTATATITDSTYELNFNASSFSITSSATDTLRVGSTVTHTVRVIDQQGNPVNGYEVRFLRYGPDDISGDVVATRTTNALGEATYSYVGKARGRGKVTAEVTDGNRRRELTSTAAFGATVKARLAKDKTKVKRTTTADRLAVTATPLAAGARVQLYRVVKGKQYQVASKKLNRKGKVVFSVRDRNRKARTTYVAVVRSTSKSVADQSNTVKTR